MILHRNKLGPPVLFRRELHRCELIGIHAAGTDISYFPAFYKVVKCLHGLFNRNGLIKAMDLQEIDVGGLETSEGCVDGIEYSLAGKP